MSHLVRGTPTPATKSPRGDAALLSAVFEHSQDGMVHMTADRMIITANRRYAEQLGIALSSLAGKRLDHVLPSGGREVIDYCERVQAALPQSCPPSSLSWHRWEITISLVTAEDASGGYLLIQRDGCDHGVLNQILMDTSDGVYIADGTGRIIAVSQTAYEQLETPQEFLGTNMGQLQEALGLCDANGHPVGPTGPMYRAMSGERFSNLPLQLATGNGHNREVLVSGGGVHSDENLHTIVTVRDATRSGRRLAALKEEVIEAQVQDGIWQQVFEAVSDGLIIFDSNRHCLAANRAALGTLGFERSPECYSEIRFPEYQLFHPDGRPFREEEYLSYQAVRGYYQQAVPYHFINSQGAQVHVLASTASIPTQSDQPLFVAALRDVTEAVQLQDRLHRALLAAEQQAAEWEAVFEDMSTGVLIYSQLSRYMVANPAALCMFGVDSLAELNQKFADPLNSGHQLLHARCEEGAPIQNEQNLLYRVIIRGEQLHNLPRKWLNLRGQELDLLVSGGPIRQVTGQDKRFAFIITDVSQLRQLERSRAEFMQVVSHELRNPLQVILGLIQLLQLKISPESNEGIGHLVQLLHQQTNHLSLLADDVLTAYRVGAGRFNLQMQSVLLSEILSTALLSYELIQHNLILEEGRDERVHVRADAQRLIQILSNLLSNAIKYTPAHKRIWISRQLERDHVVITVEDEGVGIPADQLEKVFEGFVRVHGLTEWRSGGIGLGLYISRNLARQMGGDLWAENRPGGGAMLRLRLQRA